MCGEAGNYDISCKIPQKSLDTASKMAFNASLVPVNYVQLLLGLPDWHWLRRNRARLLKPPSIDQINLSFPPAGLLDWDGTEDVDDEARGVGKGKEVVQEMDEDEEMEGPEEEDTEASGSAPSKHTRRTF